MALNRPWNDKMYVKTYIQAKAGLGDNGIARFLGVKPETFKKWLRKNPALAEALELGRAAKPTADSYKEYIYKRLSPRLQSLWDVIMAGEEDPAQEAKAALILGEGGVRLRQRMFVHALAMRNFNRSEACRLIGVPFKEMKQWISEDERFKDMIAEMEWHRDNFFEDSLMTLVGTGDTAATLFVNKTRNKQRGYDPKITVEHTGSVTHNNVIDFTQLGLPEHVLSMVLAAVRRHKELRNEEEGKTIEALPGPGRRGNVVVGRFEESDDPDDQEPVDVDNDGESED